MSTQQIILSHSIPLPNISCIEKIHAGIMVTVLLVLICAIGDCRIANLAGQVFTKDKGCIVHRQIISAGHIWQQLSDVRSVREFFFHSVCYSRDNDICGLLRWYQKTWGKCTYPNMDSPTPIGGKRHRIVESALVHSALRICQSASSYGKGHHSTV